MSANAHIWLALLLALLAPLGLLITRVELRKVRSAIVEELASTVFRSQRGLPQIELVIARYRVLTPAERARMLGQRLAPEEAAGLDQSRQDLVMPVLGAQFFILIGFIGFLLLFTPTRSLLSDGALRPDLADSLLWRLDDPAPSSMNASRFEALRTVTVAAFAFVGAYLYQLGYLIRCTFNLELSALAFIRATLRVLIGMLVAVVAYRALAAPLNSAAGWFSATLAAAFAIGYAPESQIRKLLRARLKRQDDASLKLARIIPLELLDGVDSEGAIRLQESNLHDVQNLATINPIVLYAETPYGLFEAFDWVLQAQLCVVVGPAAFRALKRHKIRTIFDLERAVLSEGAPVEYVQAIGAILFAEADDAFRARLRASPDPAPAGIAVEAVRHAAAIAGDDLHVHRLRALWSTLLTTTADQGSEERPWLYETGWLPGEGARGPLTARQEADVAVAIAAGADHRDTKEQGGTTEELARLRAQCLQSVNIACRHGKPAKDRLRRAWNARSRSERESPRGLEQFADDPDFQALLA